MSEGIVALIVFGIVVCVSVISFAVIVIKLIK